MLTSKEPKRSNRSTGKLNSKNIAPIIEMLDSSSTLFKYELTLSKDDRELKFSVVQMMTIIFFIEIKKLTFYEFRELTDGRGGQMILKNLGMPKGPDGRYIRPSDGWISDFRNHRYIFFRKDLDDEIRRMILKEKNGSDMIFTIDSTPLEASRYSAWADFNPHYRIKMAKAHIIMVDGIPFMSTFTNGNVNDNPVFQNLLESMQDYNVHGAQFYADGGYDSHDSYANTFRLTGTVLNGNAGSNGRYHDNATFKNLKRHYNKHHNDFGFRPSGAVTAEFMINYLKSCGDDIGGWFLRNLDIMRGDRLHKEAALKRHICETVHHSMKRWVDLTVRGLHKKYAERRTSLRLTVCTLLSMMFVPYSG